ncbi:MAG: hypothetical protein L6437_11465, partial [Kiritimatiellae bacterium]|nr:hypothetical protein [Kiritimatiellia bacterium]
MKSRYNILRDCEKWPRQWMGIGEDVPYGQGIVEAMRPFIAALVAKGLSDRTLRNHSGNLWLLGGEIIRDVSIYETYVRITPAAKLWESIGPGEGPYCRHLNSESEQRSFDVTCGKLYRFLEKMKKTANKQIRPVGGQSAASPPKTAVLPRARSDRSAGQQPRSLNN